MPSYSFTTLLLTVAVVLLFARPADAFGAGNIASVAKIEGLNCTILFFLKLAASTNFSQGAMEILKILS
tara:strand:+ start:476 stop:682 length:207 start_codon:yes stop_codon:yes gene_type:complete